MASIQDLGQLCETKTSEEETATITRKSYDSSFCWRRKSYCKRYFSKIMMVCKFHALSKGFSGISLDVVEKLIVMLEKDIIPVVPDKVRMGKWRFSSFGSHGFASFGTW